MAVRDISKAISWRWHVPFRFWGMGDGINKRKKYLGAYAAPTLLGVGYVGSPGKMLGIVNHAAEYLNSISIG